MTDKRDKTSQYQFFDLERLEAYASRFGMNALTQRERRTMQQLRKLWKGSQNAN